jgi:hypothetical protein
VNIITPAMPITSDGKAPDLSRILTALAEALRLALKAAQNAHPNADPDRGGTQKSVILDRLAECVAMAGGDGKYRYSLRQLFYAVRPFLLEAFGEEPDYTYFASVIRDHEPALGHDLPGIYRDSRDSLYHPHTGEEIPLGTLTVERYERPQYTINKVLYSEKEGLITTLRADRWPERHDCALATSKGQSTFAVRDLLALLDASDEPLTIFAAHDADGPGTLIYQSLVEGVAARNGGRPVKNINLGLGPGEALAMGLRHEPVRQKGRRRTRRSRSRPTCPGSGGSGSRRSGSS